MMTMQVNTRYKFPSDTFATINTSDLLGEQYVGFEVGGDAAMLKTGDMIKHTQSAIVLEKLISQFMFNKAAEDGGKK
jgi:phospholipid/cholesterol/gamma-HCH transport system substrate-binding protein